MIATTIRYGCLEAEQVGGRRGDELADREAAITPQPVDAARNGASHRWADVVHPDAHAAARP
jgi:hypothetical protein